MRFLLSAAGLALLVLVSTSYGQTDVRPQPGGKRILFVDGDDIRPEPGGKRLLFVDGDDIRPEPGGKRLLFVDGDDIRPTPGGIRLAFWDGSTLRRTPGGPILLFVDGGDTIRDKFGGTRLLFLDGPKLNRAHLTAVLFYLKPELFKLSEAEVTAKKEEMKQNGAAEDARLAADQFAGTWEIIEHYTPATPKRKGGKLAIKAQGSYYGVDFETGENPAWKGIAVKYTSKSNDRELWIAAAPAGAVGLGIYQAQGGGRFGGVWLPINAAEDKSVFGFENLQGAAQLSGVYKIVSGKLPNGGAAYTGAMNIDPLQQRLNSLAPCVRFRWANGATGIGFVFDNTVAVSAGGQSGFEIIKLKLGNGSMNGDFLSSGGVTGYYTLTK